MSFCKFLQSKSGVDKLLSKPYIGKYKGQNLTVRKSKTIGLECFVQADYFQHQAHKVCAVSKRHLLGNL